MAQRGRASERAQRALLLDAAERRAVGRGGDEATRRHASRRKERVALSARRQLQRRTQLAEARHRALLGGLRQALAQSADRRGSLSQTAAYQSRLRATDEGSIWRVYPALDRGID